MTYNLEQTREALRAAIEQRGEDYVYQPPMDANDSEGSCLYVHNRGSEAQADGCIVGVVAHALTGQVVPEGVELTVPWQNTIPGTLYTPSDKEVEAERYWSQWEDDARYLMYWTQSKQDDQTPWGQALVSAERGLLAFQNGEHEDDL